MVAFFYQLVLGEIPCPLCMLQRIGLMLVGFGFFLNVRFGASAIHYAIIILSSVAGAVASLRQVSLHVVPGTGGFGSTIFGYHMYTWGFIAFMSTIIFAAIMLVIDRNRLAGQSLHGKTWLASLLGGLLLILGLGNLASNILVCGFAVCSGDPQGYIFSR
ncbi:MAG: disulfide bond formation protein B [Burkholderiaceae bacterium]|nr:disulfide bond formation protein B [Burkholderiaceae bacterium]MCD8516406.1 disulfide bond formation protein B [Burkholderiaceae bacterium]MCD8536837.1 disulfide bond formation protein B [Burkholderiaceae bacterium]MCD8565491.1 disulfide bond formation protein B [Burkholderiaceae bacterium]